MKELREQGIYALPDGREFVAHAVFRGGYVLYTTGDWEFSGIHLYETAEELLSREALDFADICAPPVMHAALIRAAVWAKWSGHRINHEDFEQPARSMSMIGG